MATLAQVGVYTWGSCMGPECATPTSPEVPRLTDPDGDMIHTLTEPWVLSRVSECPSMENGCPFIGIETWR